MITIKFPSGITGSELLYYMGADDEQTLHERPLIARQLVAKCKIGKSMQLNNDELRQLIKEVDNMADIKYDHVGQDNWNALQQYNLNKYFENLNSLL